MPHRGLVTLNHTPAHSRSKSADIEMNPMMRRDSFHAKSRMTKAAGPTATSSTKHTRRNSGMSLGHSTPSSDSIAPVSWGNGIIDFSSFFKSARKLQGLHPKSNDRLIVDPFISSSMDTNSTMTSPCTTSASLDGDEEYDIGHSSAEVCHMRIEDFHTPVLATPFHQNSTDSSSIAERWLAMGSSSQTVAKSFGTSCHAEDEEIEVSILEYPDHHDSCRTKGRGVVELCTGTQSARLNTTDGICLEKFPFGAGPRNGTSSARYNDYTPARQPERYGTNEANNTSSRRCQNQPTVQYSSATAIQAEYTTHESSSSRDNRNKDSSSGSAGSNHSTTSNANRNGAGQLVSGSKDDGMFKRDQSDDSSSDDEDKSDSDLDYDDAEEEEKQRKEAALWKTAVDPKSGRSYYYHTVTRETQWRKPLCCASVTERRATIKKEKQTLAFFASMEQNILRSMQQQQHQQSASNSKPRWNSVYEAKSPSLVHDEIHVPQDRRVSEPIIQQPFKLVRTISTMEDSVLAALVQRVPSFRNLNNSATTHMRHGEVGHGDSASTFASFSGGHSYLNDMSMSSLCDVAPHHVLSPIQEVSSNDSKFWNSAKSSVLLQNSKIDFQETDKSENDGKDSCEQDMVRSTTREDSLQLSSVIAASRSKRRGWEESDCRFNNFEFIPEGENEDFSERSSTNHTDSSPSRAAVNRLSRQNGFINLTKVGFLLPGQDENEESATPSTHSPLRQSLTRVGGKLSLTSQTMPKETITRENSLDLACLTGGSRRLVGGQNSSSEHEASWGSYLSESAIRGLSHDEGEAMLELAAITDQMASIRSFSSSSSLVEDSQDLSENVEPGNVVGTSTGSESNGMDSFEQDCWVSDPQLLNEKPSRRASNITSRPSMIRPTSLRDAPSRAVLEAVSDKKNSMMEKPNILRRNTCGTLYVGSTLSAPDKDATIKCVCAVYRAHILQSTIEENNGVDAVDYEKYHIFNDHVKGDKQRQVPATPPTLEEITLFYRDVFTRAQMESDCIIITLIYVERIIKVTEGALRPCILNWRSILFSCMVMASKVWDDLSMWNADFSHTCPAGVQFELSRINELEIAVLSSLHYKVKVPASEYAKYYFLLRSMLIKSGLGSDDLKSMNPLDVEGAKQLQHVSSQYQASVATSSERRQAAMSRSKTTGTDVYSSSIGSGNLSDSSHSGTPSISPVGETKHHCKVGLEHMVQL